MSDVIEFYNSNAKKLSERYESLTFEKVYGESTKYLPPACTALDIGAGSGRDAAWLKVNGYEVTAIEPSPAMRRIGRVLHPENISWVDDHLPLLKSQNGNEKHYGLVLASGVWMHIPPDKRSLSFSRIAQLIAYNGILIFTLRHGPLDDRREMYKVSKNEIVQYAKNNLLTLKSIVSTADQLNRKRITWETVVFQKSDGIEI